MGGSAGRRTPCKAWGNEGSTGCVNPDSEKEATHRQRRDHTAGAGRARAVSPAVVIARRPAPGRNLPPRLGAVFTIAGRADRTSSRRRPASRDRRAHLKLIHPVVTRGLAARESLRQVETVDNRDGLAVLADSVASHGIGLRCCHGCRRAAGESAPPARVNSGTLAQRGERRDLPEDHGQGGRRMTDLSGACGAHQDTVTAGWVRSSSRFTGSLARGRK
jgi:hypothetical protein